MLDLLRSDMRTETCAETLVSSNGPVKVSLKPEKAGFLLTSNNCNKRSCRSPRGPKACKSREVGVCAGSIDMYQGIETEVLFKPRGICILWFLIDWERYRSDQGYADHRSCDSSKEPPKTFRVICMANAVGKAVILVGLHTSFDGI